MPGQINIHSAFGKIIYDLSKRLDVINIVEVGTWNGEGSTQCILRAIDNSKRFYTIESNTEWYNKAIISNKKYIEMSNVFFLLGSIVNRNELYTDDLSHQEQDWLRQDIDNYSNVSNVYNKLPENIDFLLLDGGEFSTRAEFLKLKNKSKIIALDDCNCRKNKLNIKDLKEDNSFSLLCENLNERHGWAVFEKL
tara:strand:+ start:1969 stop:2550 length:582 start_codon:yes stop_codon:yes gene_type:complete